MAAFAFRYRKEIPEFFSRDIKRRIIPVIFINLIFGFSVRIVDNSAHIGGLLSGIALALIVPYMRPNERITPVVWRTLQMICLAMILLSFVNAFRSYDGPRLAVSNLTSRQGSGSGVYFENMSRAHQSLIESSELFGGLLHASNKSGDVKPALAAVEQGTRYANLSQPFNTQAEQYRTRLLELLNKQRDILNEYSKTAPKDLDTIKSELEALKANNNQFVSDYGKWVRGL